jgi:hypothetical protein
LYISIVPDIPAALVSEETGTSDYQLQELIAELGELHSKLELMISNGVSTESVSFQSLRQKAIQLESEVFKSNAARRELKKQNLQKKEIIRKNLEFILSTIEELDVERSVDMANSMKYLAHSMSKLQETVRDHSNGIMIAFLNLNH